MPNCPFCDNRITPYTNQCAKCGEILRRPRGYAIAGPSPDPATRPRGYAFSGPSSSAGQGDIPAGAERLKGRHVRFGPEPKVDVRPIEGKGGDAQAARRGNWDPHIMIFKDKQGRKMGKCPDCRNLSARYELGLFWCPECKDWF